MIGHTVITQEFKLDVPERLRIYLRDDTDTLEDDHHYQGGRGQGQGETEAQTL